MNEQILKKLTPFYLLGTIGGTLCLITILYMILFVEYKGSFVTGLLIAILLVIILCFIFDRLLIKKLTPKKLISIEVIIVILSILSFFYNTKANFIKVSTEKQYFIVESSKDGIKLEDFEHDCIFDKKVDVINKDVIKLTPKLFGSKDYLVSEPKKWDNKKVRYCFGTNGQKTNDYNVFYNNISEKEVDSIIANYLNNKTQ